MHACMHACIDTHKHTYHADDIGEQEVCSVEDTFSVECADGIGERETDLVRHPVVHSDGAQQQKEGHHLSLLSQIQKGKPSPHRNTHMTQTRACMHAHSMR